MLKKWGRVASLAVVAGLVAFAAPAAADEVLASRLGAVLGQERDALSIVPSRRIAALTTVPSAAERGLQTAPQTISYDSDFLASLPTPSGGAQWECLAQALYHEARGETTRGLFGVGEVILNRVDSRNYPNTPCDVINQGTGRQYACQFTYTCDGRPDTIRDRSAYHRVGKVARLLLDGAPRELTSGATHYHTTAVSPSWARVYPRTASIGVHLFYRQPTRTASN